MSKGGARTPGKELPVSDHYDGRRFFNPAAGLHAPFVFDLPRWWWRRVTGEPRATWPKLNDAAPAAEPPSSIPPGVLAVTWIGHATFLLRTERLCVLTDPFFSPHAGPFGRLGPQRTRPPALPIDRLPAIDAVVLSHNHYDHLDLPALRWLARERRPRIFTTLGNGRWLEARGVRDAIELDWWQASDALPGLEVICTPAQHFSARTLRDRNRTLWGGFVLKTAPGSAYFAGDSGWCDAFESIGSRLGPFDLALLPIGAYEPRWLMKPAHMNPEESVRAHLALRARRSIGMHHGTIQLTDEPIDAPLRALEEARTHRGVSPEEFGTLEFGETGWIPLRDP